jgi:hypothetical protein
VRGVEDPPHALVELGHLAAHLGLAGCAVEEVVERGVVATQLQGRRDDDDALTLDQPLDPPVGVVALPEVLQRLAEPGEVVEVAALARLPDLQVDPGVLLLDPGPPGARLPGGLLGRLCWAGSCALGGLRVVSQVISAPRRP